MFRRSPSKLWTIGAAALGLALALAATSAAFARPLAEPVPNSEVVVLDVDGPIGPATAEYLETGLKTAAERRAPLVVIRLDTPGGLDSSTREIVRDVLASPVPVATWVAPSGARAASAGTYIVYASHLAAMAPGTHLGAATPIQIGGGGPQPMGAPADEEDEAKAQRPDAMTAKAVNDSAAYLMTLADLQGRNRGWAERAVRDAATLTADAAVKDKVVELRAGSLGELLAQADGRTVRLSGRPHVLHTAGAETVELAPDWRARVLGVITDPNIAYLLLLIGVYGLIFEFLTPGGVGPGVVGAICLVVGLFALNLLPVNFAGLGLLALGVGLLAAEAHAPSGVFAVGGAVALALGSLLLFRGPVPGFELSPMAILLGVGLSLAFFAVVVAAALRGRRAAVVTGAKAILGATGRVLNWSGGEGAVELQGEIWRARSQRRHKPGERVRVAGRDGLTLILDDVRPEAP